VSRRVLKWAVPVGSLHYIGAGPVVLVASQYGQVDVVQVWTEESTEGHDLIGAQVCGTGHPIPDGMEHVGSTVTANGALVWHVYREGRSS
jgi:hypothetical protein